MPAKTDFSPRATAERFAIHNSAAAPPSRVERPLAKYGGSSIPANEPRKIRGNWVLLLVVILAVLSVMVSVSFILNWRPTDFRILAEAGRRAGTFDLYALYDVEPFRWSPIAAYFLVPLAWIGPLGWAGLHVLAAFAFGSPRITGLLLVAFPFWHDALSGNVIVFVVLAAWWAYRGSQPAALVYLALCLLMPRPIMWPLAAWLLWQRAGLRVPFGALLAASALWVAASGQAEGWMSRLMASGYLLDHPLNIGPSALVGWAWIPVGISLAAWLTWQGRPGLAAISASPYLFPYYLLFAVLELPRLGTAWMAGREPSEVKQSMVAIPIAVSEQRLSVDEQPSGYEQLRHGPNGGYGVSRSVASQSEDQA